VKYDPKNKHLPKGVRMTGAPKAEMGEKQPHPESTMDASAKTVLIVEDNELNMKLFHDLLDAPDLILMDIQLPEVSGLEVTKWLKEDDKLKQIPVIAVTAFAMKGDEEKIRQGGCEAYISKPISVMHFLETIRKFLR
jgi:two-component system cell cycle response regulator DivK